MGLSDEERVEKLDNTLMEFLKHWDEIPTRRDVTHPPRWEDEQWKDLRRRMICAYYGSVSQSAAWVLGVSDSFSGGVVHDHTLLSPLLSRAFGRVVDEADKERLILQDSYWDTFGPDMSRLLSSQFTSWCLKTVQYVEAMWYPLRRYRDDWLEGRKAFDDVLCEILMEAKRHLDEDDLLQAYCQHSMLERMFLYEPKCPVLKWIQDGNFHHDFRPFSHSERNLAQLVERFKAFQEKYLLPTPPVAMTLEVKLDTTLWLLGGAVYGAQEREKIQKLCKKHKIPSARPLKTFDACQKMHDAYEAKRGKFDTSRYCLVTGQSWYKNLPRVRNKKPPKS